MASTSPPKPAQTSSLVDLQGQLERVTYTNDENGYTIGKVKVYGRRDLVTVVGSILNPTPGEILKMRGEWTNHPKFSEQFKVVFYKCAVPASVKGIEKYLSSGLIKGIGPVMAKRIFGIGFLPADRIAEKMGFDRQSPERAQAGIIYVLHQCSDEGHVFMPRVDLLGKPREILEVDDGILVAALAALAVERHIFIEALSEAVEVEAVYLAKFHLSEIQAAKRLLALQAAPRSIREINVDKAIEWVQDKLSITLAPMQTEAVRSAATHKVSVITGGPGTGKTTIIRAILHIFAPIIRKILLAAPTGRAAKRMSETTGLEAKTIHRLLEEPKIKRRLSAGWKGFDL